MKDLGSRKIDVPSALVSRRKRILLGVLGFVFEGIEIVDSGLRLIGKKPRYISYSELSRPVEVITKLGITKIVVPLKKDDKPLRIVGLNQDNAYRFVSASRDSFRQYSRSVYIQSQNEVIELAKNIDHLKQPSCYPAACVVSPLVKRATRVIEALPTVIPENTLSEKQTELLTKVVRLSKSFHQIREKAIDVFLNSEVKNMAQFFDTLQAYPLTPEQRLAIVTDEDATLVLAGAGSGKTSVIVSKAAYLVHRGICDAEKILLLSFGTDAAKEMAQRIKRLSGITVDTLTFHKLGYRIIQEVEGRKPPLASHANDKAKLRKLLRDILIDDLSKRPKLGKLLKQWFTELYVPCKSAWDFGSEDEYKEYVKKYELRTLNGDLVKSFEELMISNWLYSNGIKHKYEPVYDQKLPADAESAYRPDFLLTESNIYIEHFGVRKKIQSDGSIIFETAPYINREEYLDRMKWKRQVHRANDTILIETFSYENVAGELIHALQEKLAPYVTPKPIPNDQIFDKLSKMGEIDSFTKTLGNFLCLFKSSNTSIDQCYLKVKVKSETSRTHAFLQIFESVLEAYQERMEGCIDFEDMVNRAAEYVEQGRYQTPYRYLLIDEFQDISEGRARLMSALLDQNEAARLFAVGDDWQSILRFSGSDINLTYDFGERFGATLGAKNDVHSKVALRHNFRSVDKIAQSTRRFILKNDSQIKKEVVTQSSTDSPAIRVLYSNGDSNSTLQDLLEDLSNKNLEETSVMLLARYKFSEPSDMKILTSKFPKISPLNFKTVHSSKGLESDHVIILGMKSGKYGFPSNISDDPVLNLVLSKPEFYPHAEERRLFYVALSRARKSVIIIADRAFQSEFINELANDPEYEAEIIGKQEAAEVRCSSCDGLILKRTSKNGEIYFECEYHRWCGERINPCRICKKDLPALTQVHDQMKRCSCGAEFAICPKCKLGWLAERNGQYGKFLGCIRFPKCRYRKNIA